MRDNRQFEQLAGKLYACWISQQQGIGIDYAYRIYVKDRPAGDLSIFWCDLAADVHDRITEMVHREIERAGVVK